MSVKYFLVKVKGNLEANIVLELLLGWLLDTVHAELRYFMMVIFRRTNCF